MMFFSFNQNIDNTVVVTSQFLKKLKVAVSQESLKASLTGHADYPSIISITDTLFKFRVANTVAKAAPGSIDKLNVPFITRLTTNDGYFVVVTEISNEYVAYLSPDYRSKITHLSKDEFFKIWTGLVVLAMPDEHSGEQGYKAKRKAEILDNLRMPIIFLSFFLLTISKACHWALIQELAPKEMASAPGRSSGCLLPGRCIKILIIYSSMKLPTRWMQIMKKKY